MHTGGWKKTADCEEIEQGIEGTEKLYEQSKEAENETGEILVQKMKLERDGEKRKHE